MKLNITTQPRTVLGRNVKVGQFIQNPKAKDPKEVMIVIGGSEFTEAGLARLLTNEPGRHQTLAGFTPITRYGKAPGRMTSIINDREYTLIATFDGFTNE